ncbi:tetratricopeptide repeat protein [Henriciella marina]|uniref:tetratricopeptide repeat protein n=1 Tax=Henriciella marina TaxID=453851 RepID=UPI0003649D54|nr:tetratricopeptide repeat protein [Henriciella marina]
MSRSTYIWLGLALVLAGVAYLFNGRPLLPDQPYAAREAEIAARPAEDLSPGEMLARLQKAARERPDEAEPQYYIGVLLRAQGRTDDALRAFQSALRRNPEHVPALIGLADAVVTRDGGIVTDPAARLYDRAWRLDNSEVRAGILAAMPAYEAGDLQAAQAHWEKVFADLPADDPRRAMLNAMRAEADAARAAEDAE